MRFALLFANTGPFVDPAAAAEMAVTAEAAGFDSLWTVEHVIWPSSYDSTYPYDPSGKMPGTTSTPLPDPMIWLSYVAARTSTIGLGTGILILPERNPLVLAKAVATLDQLSGGRFELGIGVGWLEEEFDALGIPWERRGARTDEYLRVMRTLWSGDEVDFEGEFVSFTNVSSNPKPAQSPFPILVGGHSKAAARRAGALGDGLLAATGTPQELGEMFDIARQAAADAGRDPEALRFAAPHPGVFGDDPMGACEELRAIGADRAVLPAYALLRPGLEEAAARLKETLIDPAADI